MAGCCSGGGSGFDTASSSPFLIPGSLSLFPPTYASSPLSFFNVFGLPTAAKVTLPRDPSLSLLLLQLGSLASSFPLFSPQGGCCCSSPNKTRRVVGGGRGSAERKKTCGAECPAKKKKQKWLFLGTAALVVGVFYCPVGPIPRRRWRRTTGDSCFASLLFRNGHFWSEGRGEKKRFGFRKGERKSSSPGPIRSTSHRPRTSVSRFPRSPIAECVPNTQSAARRHIVAPISLLPPSPSLFRENRPLLRNV